ncbi:MAG: hypothetical protein RL189_2022, partial [Pseudomonadota bacterium]
MGNTERLRELANSNVSQRNGPSLKWRYSNLPRSLALTLSVREPLAVTVLALCFGLSLFQLVSGATLQGFQDFNGFNTQQLIATVLKVVTLFIALALLPTAAGVLLGVAAASGFAALYAYVRARRFYARHDATAVVAVNAGGAAAARASAEIQAKTADSSATQAAGKP